MWNFIKELRRKDHQRYLGGLDFFKYIGPGLLVTVGFIDPATGLLILRQEQTSGTPCCG